MEMQVDPSPGPAERPQGSPPPRRLLGAVLVEGEFVTHYDLERALETQKRTNEMLGEVLVGMGVLDPVDLAAALSVQGELASVKDAIRSAAGVRMLLGELLVTGRRITPSQLDRALAEQKRTGEKLGRILVRHSYITEDELDAALAVQGQQGKESAPPSAFRLGEILVATGQITREQLDRALARRKRSRKRIGELLVEAGDVTPLQVARGLRIQKKLVTAAVAAALSMATVTGAGAQDTADAGPKSPPSTARIRVTATVAARTTLEVRSQVRSLVITSGDVARGYVEAPAASRVEVRSNDPRGYLLVFEGQHGSEGPFREAIVRGLPQEVQIGPGGGWIPQSGSRGPVSMELSYRFALSGDARPGTYPFPLAISTQPL